MTHTFKKHYINEEAAYKVGYYVDGAFQKFINTVKPLYLDWLAEGNIPEEIAYIAPPLPSKDSLIDKLSRQIDRQRNNSMYSSFEYPAESGIVYDGDFESMVLLKEAVQMFSLIGSTPDGFEWWDKNKVRHPLFLADLIAMLILKGQIKETLLVSARDEKDNLQALTVEELLEYEV